MMAVNDTRRTSLARRACVVVLTCALIAVASSCGVDVNKKASQIPKKSVPFGLTTENDSQLSPVTGGQSVIEYLVRTGRVVPVNRSIRPPVNVEAIVNQLAMGPTTAELDAGTRTALSRNAIAGAKASGGIATVDLDQEFSNLTSTDQILALAQVVFTLTGLPGVGRVAFTLDGNSIEIPRADGSLATGSVSREDYAEVAPA